MSFEHILVSSNGPITTITINRPARSNALNTRTIVELRQAIEATRETPETRVNDTARASVPLSAALTCTNSAS